MNLCSEHSRKSMHSQYYRVHWYIAALIWENREFIFDTHSVVTIEVHLVSLFSRIFVKWKLRFSAALRCNPSSATRNPFQKQWPLCNNSQRGLNTQIQHIELWYNHLFCSMFKSDELTKRYVLLLVWWRIWLGCNLQRPSQILEKKKKNERKKKVGNYATPTELKLLIVCSPLSFQGERQQFSWSPFITAVKLNRRDSTLLPMFVLSFNRCYTGVALQTHSRVQHFCISTIFFLTLLPQPDITIT